MQLTGAAFVIITSTIFHRGLCYSKGAPSSKCESMSPSHGPLAQTGKSPYKIKVMKSYYMPMISKAISYKQDKLGQTQQLERLQRLQQKGNT